jgi:hypothetical protein
VSAAELETARQAWEEGNRRLLEEARDPRRGERLHAQVEVLTDELRRRVGQTFTLTELARVYATADDWAREAISERAATPGWAAAVSLATDAAFHLYQRGAVDYGP